MPGFELSPLFSDKAILCRRHEIRVFGKAADGKQITVTLFDASGHVLASDTASSANGCFTARLSPQEAAVHCTLRATDGYSEFMACDIAIGDVYLAAGQSNMELELKDADEGPEEISSHDNILVRYFNVPKYARITAEAQRANRHAHWQEIIPGKGRDMSAAAYFFAMKLQETLNVPIGIIDCYWGGTSISCWMEKTTLESLNEGRRYMREYRQRYGKKTMAQYLAEEAEFERGMSDWCIKAEQIKKEKPSVTPVEINALLGPFPWNPPAGPGSPFRPAGLCETMLRRVIPYTLTGVLYYQGEEDTWRTECYEILLSAFIDQLRRQFRNPCLPFLNVQLPMWMPAGGTDSGNWPRLRNAQWLVRQTVRNTDLAILIDQGEYDNIHPTNKRVVGDRLFCCALRTVYGMDAPEAPYAIEKYTLDGCIFVRLSQPLREPDSSDLLLEIAGEEGPFSQAEASIEDCILRLWSQEISRPVKVRYAWTDYAIAPLFGISGLPLAPFILE